MSFKLTIEPTETITRIDGVPCRLWKGTTPSGGRLDVFVHRCGSADPAAQAELEKALIEVVPPAKIDPPPVVPHPMTGKAIPFRMF